MHPKITIITGAPESRKTTKARELIKERNYKNPIEITGYSLFEDPFKFSVCDQFTDVIFIDYFKLKDIELIYDLYHYPISVNRRMEKAFPIRPSFIIEASDFTKDDLSDSILRRVEIIHIDK